MKTTLAILALLVAGTLAAPIDVPLSPSVTRGYATYSAVRIVAIDPSTDGLRVRTSLGPFMLCYPDADTAGANCAKVLTTAQFPPEAAAFIKTTIPALVKAWTQGE